MAPKLSRQAEHSYRASMARLSPGVVPPPGSLDVVEPWDGYFARWGDRHQDVPMAVQHVGWGGQVRWVPGNYQLGVGVYRHNRGGLIGRMVWDAAYGYVSGFRKRDIVYYLATRSVSRKVSAAVVAWERRRRVAAGHE